MTKRTHTLLSVLAVAGAAFSFFHFHPSTPFDPLESLAAPRDPIETDAGRRNILAEYDSAIADPWRLDAEGKSKAWLSEQRAYMLEQWP